MFEMRRRKLVMGKQKKVGILTFSYSSNYGSVLQAYALRKIISSIEGYEAHVINYSKTNYGKPIIGKDVFTKNIKEWTPKNLARWTVRMIAHPLKMRKFNNFFKTHYTPFFKKSYTRASLNSLNDYFDKFVVGSDQVWNYDSPQVDDTYFLDFVEDSHKKISYAASFGQKKIPEEKRSIAKKLITDFSSISVRESNGVDIVSDLTPRKATWVLDPSLLLDKSEYQKIASMPKEKGYVFLYLRHESKKMDEFAEGLARARGLKVIKVYRQWLCKENRTTPKVVGPYEWLGFIQAADYVVTNSFHGICFSLAFEKNFFVEFLTGTAANTNSRIADLLKQFDLLNRHIDDVKDFDDLEEIDYSVVNKFKEYRKQESLLYLKNAIEGN